MTVVQGKLPVVGLIGGAKSLSDQQRNKNQKNQDQKNNDPENKDEKQARPNEHFAEASLALVDQVMGKSNIGHIAQPVPKKFNAYKQHRSINKSYARSEEANQVESSLQPDRRSGIDRRLSEKNRGKWLESRLEQDRRNPLKFSLKI
jgi:hypothetical protein